MSNEYDQFVSAGFEWFMGVVEDRSDPDMMGRVRVRAFGYHTEDKTQIPTAHLPWATVMLPTTSAGISGIGQSPMLVEGTWVVGFFRDGRSAQDPIILGSLPGKPMQAADTTQGFNDPNGGHPRFIGESDISQLAKDNWDVNQNTSIRTDQRTTGIPTAIPPRVSSVAPDNSDDYYERQTFDEPEVREGHDSQYPFNVVTEYEGGHVTEYDSTPGNERIMESHMSGTYYEIYADGTKITKIVGDGMEIVLGKNQVFIKGDYDVTVEGNMKHLVQGNYHLEVNGNYTQRILGSRQSKIMMNDELEIIKNRAVNILQDDSVTVHNNKVSTTKNNENYTIGVDRKISIGNNLSQTVMNNQDMTIGNNMSQTNIGTLNITSNGNITIETPASVITNVDGNYTETIVGNQTTQITGNLDIDAARIDLN